MRSLFACALLLSIPATAIAGNPWEELMGPGKPNLWTDPEGRFYLDLPVSWTAEAKKGEPFVDFWRQHEDYGYAARVSVEMRTVPPRTKTSHFAARVGDEMKKSAPRYKVISERNTECSGVRARRTLFTFQEQNNADRLTEIDQVVFVVGERAFIVQLVTAAGTRNVFSEDFDKMLKGFGGRSPGDEGLPMPKARKKIKNGEMVNPDAVPY